MKKTRYFAVLAVVLLACNQQPKTDDTSYKRAEALALYQKNLEVLKTGLRAFQNEQMEVWADGVADSCVWHSAQYGTSEATKEAWGKVLMAYVADWDSITLKNAIYLPGVDTANFEPDGSVRYYGQWSGVHRSGVKTTISFYGSYAFNKANKIVSATDFFDVGGMMNAVMAKSK